MSPDPTQMTEATREQYQAFVRRDGAALMSRFGAHGVGVAHKRIAGVKQAGLAVVSE